MLSNHAFQFVETPDPAALVFRVGLSSLLIRPDKLPLLGQRYQDAPLPVKPRIGEGWCKDFVFVHREINGPTDEEPQGIVWFYFAPQTLDTDEDVPFRPMFETTRVHQWPQVLHALPFVDDPAAPISVYAPTTAAVSGQAIVYAPRVYARPQLTPETLASCRVEVRQYQRSRPWGNLESPQPVPGEVNWDFLGSNGSITALHPLIRIKARGNAYRVVAEGVQGVAPAALTPERIFPATEFPDWAPFDLIDVQFVNGVYVKEVMTIHPPDRPEEVSR
jgi:hypothetical protein